MHDPTSRLAFHSNKNDVGLSSVVTSHTTHDNSKETVGFLQIKVTLL